MCLVVIEGIWVNNVGCLYTLELSLGLMTARLRMNPLQSRPAEFLDRQLAAWSLERVEMLPPSVALTSHGGSAMRVVPIWLIHPSVIRASHSSRTSWVTTPRFFSLVICDYV